MLMPAALRSLPKRRSAPILRRGLCTGRCSGCRPVPEQPGSRGDGHREDARAVGDRYLCPVADGDPSAKATRRRDQRVLPGGVADLMNPQIRHHVTILKRYTATEEPRTPGTAPALSAGTRHPHTASRWRTALPAKPARPRPAGRAGDPDRPAMYPGGTWQPPPVNLRRHRASPATTPAHPVLHERSFVNALRLLDRCRFSRPCVASHPSMRSSSRRRRWTRGWRPGSCRHPSSLRCTASGPRST